MLGRMTPEAAAAFEERVRRDPALSRDLELLRGELGSIGRKSRRGTYLGSLEESSGEDLEEELERLLTKKQPLFSPENTLTEAARNSENQASENSDAPTSERVDLQPQERSDAPIHAPAPALTPKTPSQGAPRRKLHFIPKRVTAPRRVDNSLVFKRAAQLSAEERARRLGNPSRLNKAQLRAALHSSATYALVDAIPTGAPCLCVFPPLSVLSCAETALFEISDDVQDPCVAILPEPIANAYAAAVMPPTTLKDAVTTSVLPAAQDADAEIRLAPRRADAAPLCFDVDALPADAAGLDVALTRRRREFEPFDASFDATIIAAAEPSTRFTLTPLEYSDGRASYIRDLPTSKHDVPETRLYPFGDLTTQEKTVVPEEKRKPETPIIEEIAAPATHAVEKTLNPAALVAKETVQPSAQVVKKAPAVATPVAPTIPARAYKEELDSSADARSLVEEWIAAEVSGYTTVFPGARIMPQSTNATISAAPEPDETDETPCNLTAEDLRLAELLGREPDPIELGEYYWEEEGTRQGSSFNAKSAPTGLFGRLLYVVTAPPVWVGRKTIAAFAKAVPVDVARKDACNQTRRRAASRREPARFSDAVISVVAGIALAAGVVFPALKYVVRELFVTVATSKVRNISDNITFSQGATNADVLPFISEQILFPHYEAVEFDANGSESVITVDRQSP